ncbi:group II intron reverse transcriptase/maturase [Sorangium sp. So ce385]|uniref:group II intron reverse transcriptase/maturase n=1 Tax=Sorangium sp. So ce385 TaxID=3133308 RepID=UPI003F5BE3BA
MMDGQGKSDGPVVPAKPPNNAGRPAAEVVEGRGPTEGNTDQQNAPRTQCRTSPPRALDRVRQAAARDRNARFTALFHHVTLDRLCDAFLSLEKRAAAGVDGVTWVQYRARLEENLRDLHERLHRGAYRAKPSRRVFIPKPDGRQRPLGIASLEDKIVQRAVVEVMNSVYEVDFLGFSYGFRPGRSPHHGLDAFATGLVRRKVNWVLDADIRDFFGTIDHGWLEKFIEHRIADRRILRLIRKWLSAGVLQDGTWTSSEEGTPQGATVSPLLANVYLHYVFDLWVQQWRCRHAKGEMIVVRYADDFLVGFQLESDATRFLVELRERLRKFALELHPDKTRVLRFGRFAADNRARYGEAKPETFDFLGFTHISAKRRNGGFLLRRRTASKRMRAKLHAIGVELQRRRHQSVPEQGAWIGAVVRGYFAYHAVPTNVDRLDAFRTEVTRIWLRALRRRGQRDRTDWARMHKLADRWIPRARVLHPWPEKRFDVRTRGKSPVR